MVDDEGSAALAERLRRYREGRSAAADGTGDAEPAAEALAGGEGDGGPDEVALTAAEALTSAKEAATAAREAADVERPEALDQFSNIVTHQGGHDPDLFKVGDKGKLVLLPVTSARKVTLMGGILNSPDGRLFCYRRGVYVPGDREVKARICYLLGNEYKPYHESTILQVLRGMTAELPTIPDTKYVNFEDCLYDWKAELRLPHSDKYLSTTQFAVNFNPDAECPQMDKFVESVMHPDAILLFWQVIAYILLPGNPFQIAFLFYGTGRNGKGVVLNLLEKIIGSRSVSHITLDQMNENRFAAAELFMKYANIAGDIDPTYQKKTGLFKMITGNDTIPAERKNKDPFSFKNQATPVFSANESFGSSDHSVGYQVRWIMLHFPNDFSGKEDRGLLARLEGELEGIAAKAMRALPGLMSTGEFTHPESHQVVRDEYRAETDTVFRFLQEETTREEGLPAINSVSRPDLYRVYKGWCLGEGVTALSKGTFNKRVQGEGFQSGKVQGDYRWIGLRVGHSPAPGPLGDEQQWGD